MNLSLVSRLAGTLLAACMVLSLTACKSSPTSSSDVVDIGALSKIDTVIGTGAEAIVGSSVTVKYTGWLFSNTAPGNKGTRFDGSDDHGGSFSFTIGAGRVIKGWEQGVPGMKVGGKRTLLIPSTLGYGSAGASPGIPPNSALVFDIELLNVQ